MENGIGFGNDNMSYGIPPYMQGGNIIQLTDPSAELRRLELTFRGYEETSPDKYVKTSDPWMNEKGIQSVMGQVRSIVSRITFLSNLEDHEIRKIMLSFSDALRRDLMVKREDYDMDYDTRNTVAWMCYNMVYITMKRPYKQGDKVFFGKTTQEFRNINDQKPKKNWLSGAFGNNN